MKVVGSILIVVGFVFVGVSGCLFVINLGVRNL